MWNWIKQKSASGWQRVKHWWITLLIALGILTGGIVYAETKTFTLQNATEREDGTPFLAADLAETRIYCDGDITTPVIAWTDGSESAQAEFGIGTHTCTATHVDSDGQESVMSNIVTFDILPGRPNPPTSFTVSP